MNNILTSNSSDITDDFFQSPNCPTCQLPYWDDHRSTAAKQTCQCHKQNNYLYCPTCQLPYWDDHRSTAAKQTCQCHKQNNYLLGWKCPNCGGGVAPGVTRCPCVPLPFNYFYGQTTI